MLEKVQVILPVVGDVVNIFRNQATREAIVRSVISIPEKEKYLALVEYRMPKGVCFLNEIDLEYRDTSKINYNGGNKPPNTYDKYKSVSYVNIPKRWLKALKTNRSPSKLLWGFEAWDAPLLRRKFVKNSETGRYDKSYEEDRKRLRTEELKPFINWAIEWDDDIVTDC